MITIRNYRTSDFEEIVSWWKHYGEVSPLPGMMIEDGTFVLEINTVPALTQTIFLTQSKEIAYLEGFCKNPVFKNVNLEEYTPLLLNHLYSFASDRGYTKVFAYCKVDKLKDKYQRLGLVRVQDGLSAFHKDLYENT